VTDQLSSSSDVRSLLRHPPLLLFVVSRSFSEFSWQIATVAVGWQIYQLTGSAFYLGMVGLVQFIPSALLIFIAGHAADRYDRRRVVQLCQFAQALAAAYLAWRSFTGSLAAGEILIAIVIFGIATAFESPALSALLPGVAPEGGLQRATALSSGAGQLATITGPAIGGLVFAIAPAAPFAIMTLFWLLAGLAAAAIQLERTVKPTEPPTFSELFAGISFVRDNPAILGTISLDLFAVLLGDSIALAPVFARTILDIGPIGLGALRAAPSIGALAAGLMLARRPLQHRAGRTLLAVIATFGAAMIVFGLSKSLPLSLAALAVAGFVDMISVNIRATTLALVTPMELQGRVNAVEWVFIGASNELGAFESGAVASLIGTVGAVVAGGAAMIGIAATWPRLFPALTRMGRLDELRPATAE